MVSLFQGGYARAAIDDDAGAFMAEDGRENAFGIIARQGKGICVTDAGRLDFNEDLALSLALISTRTSPSLGPSSVTVSIESGSPAFVAMAARVSMVCIPVLVVGVLVD